MLHEVNVACRSLWHAKGLSAAVIVTLALGIGANAAIFSVVRSVLLRPLVNREADRLIYIRQAADGLGLENLTFSVPEIDDFKSRARTVTTFGDFSTVDFTLIGFDIEPRLVRAGVVNGSFFDVMGLRPVLGRLLGPAEWDGEAARRHRKYLAYWIRRPEGWRVVAYRQVVRAPGDVSTAPLPPSLPGFTAAPAGDVAAVEAHQRSLAAAEQAFSDRAQQVVKEGWAARKAKKREEH